ncbi:hypothetical protein BGZ47_000797, partial [Haplosporangium gracile]
SILLLAGPASFAVANSKTCNWSGKKQVCCSGGILNCAVQIIGSFCTNTYYCKTDALVGAIVNVELLNCV